MVRHTVDDNEFLVLITYDARDVFVQFFLPALCNEVLPSLDCKHDMHIQLSVRIRHAETSFRDRNSV